MNRFFKNHSEKFLFQKQSIHLKYFSGERNRPLRFGLFPFPFPATGFFGLYETDSKSGFVREYVFLKFILENIS